MNKDCLTGEQYSIQNTCSDLPEIKWSGQKVMETDMLKIAEENLQVKQPTLNSRSQGGWFTWIQQNSRWEFVSFIVTDNE